MSLDLDPVRAMLEADFMDDLLRLSDTAGPDVLDPDTLVLTPQVGATVWEQPGLVVPAGGRTEVPAVAEQNLPVPPEADYVAVVPLAAPMAAPQQVITVYGSRLPAPRDPAIVGRRFRVVNVPNVSTFAVARIIWLESVS